ncbi:IclR family transcriptional regulator [Paracidovorax citrulli]
MTTHGSSLRKACGLLRAMTDPRNSRLTDLAQASGVDKASALRLLETLAAEGLVSRDPATKAYSPGPEWLVLRAAALRRLDLRPLARPALIRLASAFEDTAILSVPSGSESVCAELRLGSFPIRANYLDIGSRRPLGVGAGSLALLAALPDDEIEAVLQCVAPALKRYPRLNAAALLRHVEATRARGYAVLLDVVVERMGGIAVALPGPDGYPLGALSIAALNERIVSRESAMAKALRREADGIAANLDTVEPSYPDRWPRRGAARRGVTTVAANGPL